MNELMNEVFIKNLKTIRVHIWNLEYSRLKVNFFYNIIEYIHILCQ